MGRLFAVVVAAVFSFSVNAAQDPTAPLGWTTPKKATGQTRPKKRFRLPSLQSIVCENGADCVAVLDNKVIAQGEKVNGFVASRVTPEFVIVKQGTRQWRLELFSKEVKY